MSEGEGKTERLSFALRPKVAERLKEREPNVSEYVEELITADLLKRGLLTVEELKSIIYGAPA